MGPRGPAVLEPPDGEFRGTGRGAAGIQGGSRSPLDPAGPLRGYRGGPLYSGCLPKRPATMTRHPPSQHTPRRTSSFERHHLVVICVAKWRALKTYIQTLGAYCIWASRAYTAHTHTHTTHRTTYVSWLPMQWHPPCDRLGATDRTDHVVQLIPRATGVDIH